MKILTNKEYENRIRWAREGADADAKMKAATLDFISALFSVEDFSKMSTDEIKEFFKYNPDCSHRTFARGMKAGIDSIIDTFEMSGIVRKRTLEKLRFRAVKNVDECFEELLKEKNDEQI